MQTRFDVQPYRPSIRPVRPARPPRVRDRSAGPRVLIVEDDALTALMLTNVLMDLGCEVCGLASTGPRAVALADYHRPDLALVDIRLANDTDGFAAARQMKQELKLNVVLMTGTVPEEEVRAAEDLPLLRKPFDVGHVESMVRKHLDVPRLSVA